MNLALPSYWLPRPPFDIDSATRDSFDRLIDRAIAAGPAAPIDYQLPAPRWQFLCYACEARNLVMHGSPNPTIERFEPRKASDLREFGAQQAVYAAADGIWPMYFAIIDRSRSPTTLINACIRLESPDRQIGPPMYVFSVSRQALENQAWSSGTVYLLPRETFVPETPMPFGPYHVHTAQLASTAPVNPLAKLSVSPDDFPFLSAMRGHDNDRLEEYANAMINAQPWPED